MNLLAYSDSESDGETPAAKPAPKPAFQKVVDRANPGRIKLNLPGASQPPPAADDTADQQPPTKKPRLGGGGGGAFAGFSSMLPAPKKAAPVAAKPAEGAAPAKRGLGKALAAGVNLKTGAEPAFKREPRPELDDYDEQGNPITQEPKTKADFRALLNLPPPKTETKQIPTPNLQSEPPPASKPAAPRFVPMSVGKGKKKKPTTARPVTASTEPTKTQTIPATMPTPASKPAPKPKVSLFGVSHTDNTAVPDATPGQYQPLLYGDDGDDGDDDEPMPDESFDPNPTHHPTPHAPAPSSTSDPLSSIAAELNLSSAERRQLFGKHGRGGPDFSATKIVEFNTDAEYAHNEQLRQQGEQAPHNPLKSISGTGKNSLRSLVSSASMQKDALEDHFAAAHRNKKEAGNRYGW